MTAAPPLTGTPRVQTMRHDRRIIHLIVSRNRRRRLAAAAVPTDAIGLTTEDGVQLLTEDGDELITES